MTTTTLLTFRARAKKCDTETSERRRWFSTCGEYCVEQQVSRYGFRQRWLALLVTESKTVMLGTAFSRAAAEHRCQEHAETGR